MIQTEERKGRLDRKRSEQRNEDGREDSGGGEEWRRYERKKEGRGGGR